MAASISLILNGTPVFWRWETIHVDPDHKEREFLTEEELDIFAGIELENPNFAFARDYPWRPTNNGNIVLCKILDVNERDTCPTTKHKQVSRKRQAYHSK